MGLKDFFKERLGLGGKNIELRQKPEELPMTEEPEVENIDTRATRRYLFESKMLRVISLAIGLEIAGVPAKTGVEVSPAEENYKTEQAELQKKLGPQFDGFMAAVVKYEAQKEQTSETLSMEVGNFEEVNVANDEIKNFLYKGYPEEWLAHISGVSFIPGDLDMPEEYGIKETKQAGKPRMVAYVTRRGELGGSTVMFSKEINNFFREVSHELGHANDWLARTDLSKNDRIELFYNVVKRVQSPDRFKSAYVESINNKDKYLELNLKTNEYWAEIIQVYFDNPTEAATLLAPDDYRLIEQYLKIAAPHLDLKAAALERQVRGKLIKQELVEKKIVATLSEEGAKNPFAVLKRIKNYAATSARVGKAGVLVEQNTGDASDELDQDVILEEAFSHGDKKWLEAIAAFLATLEEISDLAQYYKEGDIDNCESLSRGKIEVYQSNLQTMNKQIKKFPPAEQKKIKAFYKYLENVLQEADILPSSVIPESYY